MKLNNQQIDFLLDFFPATISGAKEIAKKLLTNGKCIIAGTNPIWVGGIGNFIKTKPVEDAYQCTELTLDLEMFLESEWFKDEAQGKLLEVQRNIYDLQSKAIDITELIEK